MIKNTKALVLVSLLLGGVCTPILAQDVQPVGKDIASSPESIAPAFHNQPKENELAPLNYVNQPPMVPHSTKNYQVTKNTNQCLDCHSVQASRTTGATRISPTHFVGRDGVVSGEVSPRRYFCVQCHVSQSDVAPIVPNEFKPLPGYGEK
ncbi:nitrate reductase cytochrome c-type subunit [Testudinibacter sp. TR-2022]|uniref:nitrate reductase cytochrome c-type subunit n=1 Tax=Testudinibacter sp. TR-2022 TaxID=2585029 RepID=UPI001118E813|nr:nitrate reductase cytochrome c-type subunit [Testudinibacter sp. TR-2022]TNH06699.1 nitrate reductase cytochrome c-type subunit [Pasteurellaceae bacterium Phil11]TNH23914.1 nitrate reductase cytochrome c-type subunit [Testudinibacter sp. TR-2022]TNH25316.1 nitrate reductase cytochrome c-type subunit [Testudinibacter sp. TR-2022]